jgi:thiaminase
MITQQEFNEWLEHPVTSKFRQQIRKDIDFMQDMLIDVSAEDLKELQGRIKASINMYEVSYEDLHERPRNNP